MLTSSFVCIMVFFFHIPQSLTFLLFLNAAFQMFLHLIASLLAVRLELTAAVLLLLAQIPHLHTRKTNCVCEFPAQDHNFKHFPKNLNR